MDQTYINTYSSAITTAHADELKSIASLKEGFVELQKDAQDQKKANKGLGSAISLGLASMQTQSELDPGLIECMQMLQDIERNQIAPRKDALLNKLNASVGTDIANYTKVMTDAAAGAKAGKLDGGSIVKYEQDRLVAKCGLMARLADEQVLQNGKMLEEYS